MGLKEMLAEKQAEMAALAASGAGLNKDEIAAKLATGANQATGMASSTAGVSTMPTIPKPIKGEIDTKLAEASIAVYEDNDFKPMKKVIRNSGTATKAVEGFFYAQDEEDIKLLDHYVKIGLATLVAKKDAT